MYMWNVKFDTNELNYKTETDSNTEKRLVAKGAWGGMDGEFGISR